MLYIIVVLISVFSCEVWSYSKSLFHAVNCVFSSQPPRSTLFTVSSSWNEYFMSAKLRSQTICLKYFCYTETFQLFLRVYRISKSIVPITKDILNSNVSSRVDNEFIGFFNAKLVKHLFYFYLEILLRKQHAGMGITQLLKGWTVTYYHDFWPAV